jgi:histidinol phosphatase-like enzyme
MPRRAGFTKPERLLHRPAARKFDIDLASSFLTGDGLEDMLASRVPGCGAVAAGRVGR